MQMQMQMKPPPSPFLVPQTPCGMLCVRKKNKVKQKKMMPPKGKSEGLDGGLKKIPNVIGPRDRRGWVSVTFCSTHHVDVLNAPKKEN